jgi:hypothetical protein
MKPSQVLGWAVIVCGVGCTSVEQPRLNLPRPALGQPPAPVHTSGTPVENPSSTNPKPSQVGEIKAPLKAPVREGTVREVPDSEPPPPAPIK